MSDSPATRVVIADDHVEMLQLASSTLRETCDVVASVGDGDQAVESVLRLNPDVVVLDITMPGLDGFQAARELRQRGSQAKVVFLSLHEGDEFVVTAFQTGAQAFVPKHRMLTDLASAVGHVSAGRVFLPSLSSLSAVADRGGHGVMFYSRRQAWWDQAARLVRSALTRGDAVHVLAREDTHTGVAAKLSALGFDTAQAEADRRYVLANAEETLEQVMVDGQPDARRIATVVGNLEDTRRALSRPHVRMTIIGELAPCLGPHQRDEIMGIERLWNEIAGGHPFLTVCGYSIDRVRDKDGDGQPWPAMCSEHWAVTQVLED